MVVSIAWIKLANRIHAFAVMQTYQRKERPTIVVLKDGHTSILMVYRRFVYHAVVKNTISRSVFVQKVIQSDTSTYLNLAIYL